MYNNKYNYCRHDFSKTMFFGRQYKVYWIGLTFSKHLNIVALTTKWILNGFWGKKICASAKTIKYNRYSIKFLVVFYFLAVCCAELAPSNEEPSHPVYNYNIQIYNYDFSGRNPFFGDLKEYQNLEEIIGFESNNIVDVGGLNRILDYTADDYNWYTFRVILINKIQLI